MICLYRRLLGAQFEILPDAVRALHEIGCAALWVGQADVDRGTTLPARIIAAVFGLPPAGLGQQLTCTFELKGASEIWKRQFGGTPFLGGTRFRSVQFERDGRLNETVGPVRLIMALHADADGLRLTMTGARFLGVPLPVWLVPRISTAETERGGRYHFDVEASMPGVGRLVHYRGWLEPRRQTPI
jgi:hypothetical protein